MNVRFTPVDTNFQAHVRCSFEHQPVMRSLGVGLRDVFPGQVTLELPYNAKLTQQHGFLHGGIVSAVMDSACGYSALTLLPAGAEVLTIEFKANFLRPARQSCFRAMGVLTKAGKSISFCTARFVAVNEANSDKLIATMSATIKSVETRSRPSE